MSQNRNEAYLMSACKTKTIAVYIGDKVGETFEEM